MIFTHKSTSLLQIDSDLLHRLWREVLRERATPTGEERENIIENG